MDVHVDHASGGLGARVVRLLASDAAATVVPAEGCEVLVWLAAHDVDTLATRRASALDGLAAALAATTATHVVLVSSAMVYGAWANNPVPLTEQAALRPDVEFAYARQLGAAEQVVDEWRLGAPGRTAAVLRPAVAMAADGSSRLATALAAGMGQRMGEADPPAQFLHLDDLAGAVVLAATQRLDGVYNVAPDGWVPGERVRALAGAVPTVTNEQAYVEGTEAKWWTMVSPKRRQELSLGALVAVLLGATVAVVRVVRAKLQR